MKPAVPESDFNAQIIGEACAWFIDMRAGDVDVAGRQRFDQWLRKSPENLRAYLEVSEIWDDARLVKREHTGNAEELLARARAGADVVPLAGAAAAPGVSSLADSRWLSSPWTRFSAAAAVLLAVGALTALAYQHYRPPTYVTGIGEQRVVLLPDGSRVELNSRTRLTVRFTERERDVELASGQALFRVAKNAARPFVVQSGDVSVRAVGTEFDVDRKQSATTVTVLEGRVAVRPLGGDLPGAAAPKSGDLPPAVMVGAGEQVKAARAQPLRATRADVAAATAWTRGTLIFEGSRLADVVEDFNRHNERQLVIGDPALRDMRISGVYSSTDPALLVRFLAEQPGVRVEETDSTVVIRTK